MRYDTNKAIPLREILQSAQGLIEGFIVQRTKPLVNKHCV